MYINFTKCTKYGKGLRLHGLQESSLNWGDVERTCLQPKSQSIRNTSKPQFLLKVINKSTIISHDLYFSWPKKWRQNVQNLSGTSHRWVVSLQICEHFDAVSMVNKRTGHGKLLFSTVITLKGLMSISVEVSWKIACTIKRKTNCATITSLP